MCNYCKWEKMVVICFLIIINYNDIIMNYNKLIKSKYCYNILVLLFKVLYK